MNRRFLCIVVAVLALGLLAAPLAVEAQTDRSKPRIAILFVSVPTANLSGPKPKEDSMAAFLEGMHELGFVDGQNIVIERRSAEGQADRYPALLQEMVNLGVDVLVVSGAPILVQAAQQATRTIPIVMVGLGGDPVGLGLAKSLPSPGGNVTGSTFGVDSAMNGKRLALLKEVAPRISRVAVLHPPSDGPGASTESAARALGLPLLAIPVDASQPITGTLTEVSRKKADALLVGGGRVLRYQREIIEFAATNRLPAMGVLPGYARAGGLMGYGASYYDLFRRSAGYVSKILKGTKPGDLPIEQPTKFDLIINQKTAKTLGLTIPPSLLAGADQVIE